MIEAAAQTLLDSELRDGEKLLWAGRPCRRVMTALSLKIIALLILPGLLAFAGTFVLLVRQGFAPKSWWWLILLLIGLVFVYNGLKALWQMRHRAQKLYAITDRQVIVKPIKPNSKTPTLRLGPGDISAITRKPFHGTAIFNAATPGPDGQMLHFTLFAYVKAADRVERLLQNFISEEQNHE